ncbi:riboflavin synthase [Fodinicola acaciae]|uniref:riboflavin synthase n=1 Tax=Fodinicola acaciae TaxID=2681555 RepID=UPI0013D1060B|nr:riboflavin synthase [Fodinicola acaciae]
MFTGIVEELGSVVSWSDLGTAGQLTLHGPTVSSDARHGDSIAVNGVCLTVIRTDGERFTVDVMAETLKRSTVGELQPGDPVNLERAVRASDRLGGHIVQGHVDDTATLLRRESDEHWDIVRFQLAADTARYLAEKGSVAVDGVSLTVSGVGADWFEVSLIPTTLGLTTLGKKEPGQRVNIEVDVIAKYVERLVSAR